MSPIRDYIHVEEVADIVAQSFLLHSYPENPLVLNVGTGIGTSSKELLDYTSKIGIFLLFKEN